MDFVSIHQNLHINKDKLIISRNFVTDRINLSKQSDIGLNVCCIKAIQLHNPVFGVDDRLYQAIGRSICR